MWCDAAAFEEALEAGDPEKSVELYRGDLLEGFFIAEASEFENWLAAERQRLAERYAEALRLLAERAEQARDFGGAVVWWKRLVAKDPYNSRYVISLMDAMAAAGDRGNALQLAQEHERLLREELGVEPDEAFLARMEGLRRETGPPVEVPGEAKITGPTSLAGRLRKTPGRWPTQRNPIRTALITVAVLALAIAGYAALRAVRYGAWEGRISHAADESPKQIRRIAVLPLQYLPPDPEQDYFAEAMTDQLINDLGKIGALEVISRTSAMRYRETEKSIPEIARELRVDAVVEGSVLRADGRVRITAQLIEGATDQHLWANSYERDFRDILALQGDLARAIAAAVQVALTPDDEARLRARTVNSEAHEAYLKAAYFIEKNRLHRAIEYGEAAIAADSNYAPGYAVLARACLGLPYISAGEDPAEVWPKARQLAERALQLDSTCLEAQFVRAALLAVNDWNWDAAVRELRRIHELEPTSDFAHVFSPFCLLAWAATRKRSRSHENGFGSIRFRHEPFATWLTSCISREDTTRRLHGRMRPSSWIRTSVRPTILLTSCIWKRVCMRKRSRHARVFAAALVRRTIRPGLLTGMPGLAAGNRLSASSVRSYPWPSRGTWHRPRLSPASI